MSDCANRAAQKLSPTRKVRDRIGLCLSGDGMRAALFQAGTLRRLNELGLLSRVSTIGCVAGGSLVGGVLAGNWQHLCADNGGVFENFDRMVAEPIERLAQSNLRLDAMAGEWLKPWRWLVLWRGQYTRLDRLIRRLDRRWMHGLRLADLPERPRFSFLSTNLCTGRIWQLERTVVGEPALGFLPPGRLRLAEAVAASAAHTLGFPPLFLSADPRASTAGSLEGQADALRHPVWLADGSLADSLAVETIWRTHSVVICSDGGHLAGKAPHYRDWLGNRLLRSWKITTRAARDLGKRWLIDLFRHGQRTGVYLGLDSYHGNYHLAGSVGYSEDVVKEIDKLPTNLTPLSPETAMILVNHGYTLADTAFCRHLEGQIKDIRPLRLPFPDMVEQREVLSLLARAEAPSPMPRAA